METIHNIMFGKLRPWLESTMQVDEFYKPEIRSLKTIQTAFNPHYELKFIRHFSNKTQYYKKLIDNDITDYCNTLFHETGNVGTNRVKYKVNKANKDLYARIKELSEIIRTQNFDLSYINSSHVDFSTDKPYKESTYITFYLLSALIACCMEVQKHFLSSIHEDDIMEVSDFYTRLLQQQAPANTYISESITIPVEEVPSMPQKANEEEFSTQYAQDKYSLFMEVVVPYRFEELPKYKALTQAGKNRLARLIVENPVYYAMAMLSFLEYLNLLKKTYYLNNEKMYKHIAKALGVNVRTIKGNYLVLNSNSKEDRYKYPAADFVGKVKEDYENLLAEKPFQ